MLGRTNAAIGSPLKNEDITVTKNGTYSAGEGFTGLGTVVVDVPAKGNTLSAVNKTGANITAGDKVWINENVQTTGSSYNILTGQYSPDAGPILGPSGTYGWCYGKLYSINSESASPIGNRFYSYEAVFIQYLAPNLVCLGSKSVFNENINYSLSEEFIAGSSYSSKSNSTVIHMRDLNSGDIIKTYEATNSNHYTPDGGDCCCFNNIIYGLTYDHYKYVLNDEDNTYVRSTYNANFSYYNAMNLGNLLNENMALVSTASSNINNPSNLLMIKYVDDNTLKVLSQSEMPVELQPYYSEKKAVYCFNPYTGILTAVTSPTDYAVIQYKNGTWTKLPIEISYDVDPSLALSQIGAITLSDDLSRAAISYRYKNSGIYHGNIVNLTTHSGYIASPYKFYNITNTTQTGYAAENADADATFTANIASNQPLVMPTPVGEKYAIDEGGINLLGGTVLSGPNGDTVVAPSNQGISIPGAAEAYSGMFNKENHTADTFIAKIKIMGLGNGVSDGSIYPLSDGNFMSKPDQSLLLSASLRFYDPGTYSDDWAIENIAPAVDKYYNNQWNQAVYLNGSGVYQLNNWFYYEYKCKLVDGTFYNCITIYDQDKTMIDTYEKADRYGCNINTSTIQLLKPLFATSYFDVQIDLAETGFKLGDEWVWRPVKKG